MKATIHTVDDHGVQYRALMFVCPGCQTPYTLLDGTEHTPSGLHSLPVYAPGGVALKQPAWQWDGDLVAPTLTPSILTRIHPYSDTSEPLGICHSFLTAGVFHFLADCTHQYAGQQVPMPDLPQWVP